jgi:hypothetical protein
VDSEIYGHTPSVERPKCQTPMHYKCTKFHGVRGGHRRSGRRRVRDFFVLPLLDEDEGT